MALNLTPVKAGPPVMNRMLVSFERMSVVTYPLNVERIIGTGCSGSPD